MLANVQPPRAWRIPPVSAVAFVGARLDEEQWDQYNDIIFQVLSKVHTFRMFPGGQGKAPFLAVSESVLVARGIDSKRQFENHMHKQTAAQIEIWLDLFDKFCENRYIWTEYPLSWFLVTDSETGPRYFRLIVE